MYHVQLHINEHIFLAHIQSEKKLFSANITIHMQTFKQKQLQTTVLYGNLCRMDFLNYYLTYNFVTYLLATLAGFHSRP